MSSLGIVNTNSLSPLVSCKVCIIIYFNSGSTFSLKFPLFDSIFLASTPEGNA